MEINYDERAKEFAKLQAEDGQNYELNMDQLKSYAKFTAELWGLDLQQTFDNLLSSVKRIANENYKP